MACVRVSNCGAPCSDHIDRQTGVHRDERADTETQREGEGEDRRDSADIVRDTERDRRGETQQR